MSITPSLTRQKHTAGQRYYYKCLPPSACDDMSAQTNDDKVITREVSLDRWPCVTYLNLLFRKEDPLTAVSFCSCRQQAQRTRSSSVVNKRRLYNAPLGLTTTATPLCLLFSYFYNWNFVLYVTIIQKTNIHKLQCTYWGCWKSKSFEFDISLRNAYTSFIDNLNVACPLELLLSCYPYSY